MKTHVSKLLALGALLCLFLVPIQESKAQVLNPYQIMNNLPCNVTIRWVIFDWNPNGTGCNLVCDAGTAVVPPGVTPIFWNPACAGCKVQVYVLAINGTPIPIITGAFPPPPPQHGFGPDPTGCSPTGMINLHVHPHGADILP